MHLSLQTARQQDIHCSYSDTLQPLNHFLSKSEDDVFQGFSINVLQVTAKLFDQQQVWFRGCTYYYDRYWTTKKVNYHLNKRMMCFFFFFFFFFCVFFYFKERREPDLRNTEKTISQSLFFFSKMRWVTNEINEQLSWSLILDELLLS